MKKLILLGLITLLCLPLAVYAASIDKAENQYFQKGDWEVGFHGSYDNLNVKVEDESEKINLLYLDGAVSYFLTNNNEHRPHDALGDLTPAEYMEQNAGNSILQLST